MGCGCGMNVTAGPMAAGVPGEQFAFEQGQEFSASSSGEETKTHPPEVRRVGPALQAAAGFAGSIWDARPAKFIDLASVPVAPVEPVVIPASQKPDQAAIVEAAKRLNKEKHARKITLVQLERTRRAMCFACLVVSHDGKRCMLAPQMPVCMQMSEDEPGTSARPAGFEPTTGVIGDEVAWICAGNGACPLGRHPVDGGTGGADEDMVTRWAPWWFPISLRWYGVPEPLRWWIAVRRWKNDTLPKCGCSVALKQACKRLGWLGRKIDVAMSSAPKVRKAFANGKVFRHGPDEFWPRAFRYSRRWVASRLRRGITDAATGMNHSLRGVLRRVFGIS